MTVTAWNTGNQYTAEGQRIGIARIDAARIVFFDIDRGIWGTIPCAQASADDAKAMIAAVTSSYLRNGTPYIWRGTEEEETTRRQAAVAAQAVKPNNK